MSTIYAVNVPVTGPAQVHVCAYHFYSWCVQFPVVRVAGTALTASVMLETATGSVNSSTPSRLFSSAAVFTASHVGKYVAVRDPVNPSNSGIYRIMAQISSTEVQLNAPVANFTISSTNLALRVFDLTIPSTLGDYFVIANKAGTTPTWQARVSYHAATSTVAYEVAPVGGYAQVTNTWNGPVSSVFVGYTVATQAFFLGDLDGGWGFQMTEDVGGVASNRNATWMGSVGSIHAQAAAGFPRDSSYAGVLGTVALPQAHNIGRDTTGTLLISTGEFGSADSSAMILGALMSRETLSTGVDVLTMAAAATDPRTGNVNDYDFVLAHRTPSDVRGYIPGLRTLADAVINRTLISAGATYALGDGIGLVWNGKPVV